MFLCTIFKGKKKLIRKWILDMYTFNSSDFFCSTLFNEKNDFIDLIQFGWEKCAPLSTLSKYRDMYIIYIVTRGLGTIETNREKIVLGVNDAFIIRPHELIVQTAYDNEPWEFCFIAFNGNFAKHLVEKTAFSNNDCVSLEDDSVSLAIEKLTNQIDKSNQSIFYCLNCLIDLLSYFEPDKVNPLSNQVTNMVTQQQKYIFHIRKYIDKNYFKQIKVSEIAEQLNVNRSHLYRVFKEKTGLSIENYIINVRISKACDLLHDTELSAKEVAEKVGYSDYSTFFTNFKRLKGLSPIQYKNMSLDDQ